MEKAKRDLKSISIFLIVLGAFDLISSIISTVSTEGQVSTAAIATIFNASAEEASVYVAAIIVFCVIGFLLQLYIGLKGIIIANGGKKSGLVTVVVVLSIILLVIGGVGAIASIMDGSATVLSSRIIVVVCELILFCYYMVAVKKVIALRATTV